jgi:hypothetical protein
MSGEPKQVDVHKRLESEEEGAVRCSGQREGEIRVQAHRPSGRLM